MDKRPNILVLVNDHQAYYRHGWDGGVRPMTPNFDRLAAEGIRFERSYCAVPLCGPSRRTLATGLYPHNHGNHFNYTHAPYDREVYLSTLARGGYRCYYFGKWHAGEGSALDFGCEGFSTRDYGNPYCTPEYLSYLERHNLPPAEHLVERVFDSFVMDREFPQLKAGTRYRCDRHWCGEHASGITVTPDETHESFFLASLACDQLERIAMSDSDQPFHLRVDFWGPHQPYFPTQAFADLYDPKQIEEYGSFRDPLTGKSELFWNDPHRPLTDENGRFATPNRIPWSEWQQVIARAFAHITMIDAAGGRILSKLEELGLADNTLVIWTADHGDALASHGGRFDKGSYLTEEVLRVPLAMRLPGRVPGGQVSDSFACGVDLAPTILDAAELQFERPADGQSLLPVATGERTSVRNSLMVETYGHGFGTIELGRALLKDRYKLVLFQNHAPELYDLDTDPYELNNLAGLSEFAALFGDLRAELLDWLERTEDHDFALPVSDAYREHDRVRLQELLQRRAAWKWPLESADTPRL